MDDNKTQKMLKNPNDFIIQGKESFALLYNIFNRIKKTQEIQENQLKIQKQQLEFLKNISRVQDEESDEGEVMRLSGTVTTTEFIIINTIINPGHPVKAFELINDGNNTIYVGHNATLSGTELDITDITSDISRFDKITIGEDVKYRYNRNKIRNIYMLSSGGNSNYRIKLIW